MLRYLTLAVMMLLIAVPVSADIIHSVRFESGPTVMVWGDAERRVAPASIPPAPIMVGRLVSAETPRSSAQFQIASNSGFSIVADISDLLRVSRADMNDATYTINIVDTGPNADTATFRKGPLGTGKLADLMADPAIFNSHHKTAAQAGNPKSQAVTFAVKWSGVPTPVNVSFDVVANDY